MNTFLQVDNFHNIKSIQGLLLNHLISIGGIDSLGAEVMHQSADVGGFSDPPGVEHPSCAKVWTFDARPTFSEA